MPPCTHCEYTRCPKCGHDCGQAPKASSQGNVDNSKVPLEFKISPCNLNIMFANAPEASGVLAKPGSGEE